jgi:hypothetical protein
LNGRQTRASCEAAAHNVTQRQIFDRKAAFFAKPLPPEIENKLKRIVSSVPDIAGRRIIDAGSGISACFILIAVATQKHLPLHMILTFKCFWHMLARIPSTPIERVAALF